MDAETIAAFLTRELRSLRREIGTYPDDRSLWARPPGIANSGGTLALHMVGNLRHFVGTRLGGTEYVRDRAAEFEDAGLSREELTALVDTAIDEVTAALARLDAARLAEAFPDPVAGQTVGTRQFLLHLMAHSAYHLGQVDYHRRIVTGTGDTVGAVAVPEIPGAKPEG